jgi:hypothetical protein
LPSEQPERTSKTTSVIRAASTSRVRLTPVKRTNGVALLRPRASPRIASRSTLRSRTRTDWRSRVTRQTEAAKRGLHPSVLEGAADEENLIGGKVAKRILDDEHRVGLRLALDLGRPGERPFTGQRAHGGLRTGVDLVGREPFERPAALLTVRASVAGRPARRDV